MRSAHDTMMLWCCGWWLRIIGFMVSTLHTYTLSWGALNKRTTVSRMTRVTGAARENKRDDDNITNTDFAYLATIPVQWKNDKWTGTSVNEDGSRAHAVFAAQRKYRSTANSESREGYTYIYSRVNLNFHRTVTRSLSRVFSTFPLICTYVHGWATNQAKFPRKEDSTFGRTARLVYFLAHTCA